MRESQGKKGMHARRIWFSTEFGAWGPPLRAFDDLLVACPSVWIDDPKLVLLRCALKMHEQSQKTLNHAFARARTHGKVQTQIVHVPTYMGNP